MAMSLHTFVASGGIGTPTYEIVSGDEDGHFDLGVASGVLSLVADAEPDTYVLRIQAMDVRHNTAEVLVTVGVSAVLSLADAPSFTVIASVAMSLHTFIASGGVGLRTYTLLAGDERYFSVGAGSGVLSLSMHAEVGSHTLTVQVMDGWNNTVQAVATVEVSFGVDVVGGAIIYIDCQCGDEFAHACRQWWDWDTIPMRFWMVIKLGILLWMLPVVCCLCRQMPSPITMC